MADDAELADALALTRIGGTIFLASSPSSERDTRLTDDATDGVKSPSGGGGADYIHTQPTDANADAEALLVVRRRRGAHLKGEPVSLA